LLRVYTAKNNYLFSSGWVRSLGTFLPEDADGKPLPWYSYPMIEFLNGRLESGFCVFEYGTGNSTRWFASRVKTVDAVEHDEQWARHAQDNSPHNVRIMHHGDDETYPDAPNTAGRSFDIIVIDGLRRVECAERCLDCLAPDGVIIFDDAQREGYRSGFQVLESAGFRRLDFYGLAPINATPKSTCVFYRPDNCLKI
jgi:tRNA A58 N-methylase Trm61